MNFSSSSQNTVIPNIDFVVIPSPLSPIAPKLIYPNTQALLDNEKYQQEQQLNLDTIIQVLKETAIRSKTSGVFINSSLLKQMNFYDPFSAPRANLLLAQKEAKSNMEAPKTVKSKNTMKTFKIQEEEKAHPNKKRKMVSAATTSESQKEQKLAPLLPLQRYKSSRNELYYSLANATEVKKNEYAEWYPQIQTKLTDTVQLSGKTGIWIKIPFSGECAKVKFVCENSKKCKYLKVIHRKSSKKLSAMFFLLSTSIAPKINISVYLAETSIARFEVIK